MPSCFFASGSVRPRMKHIWALSAVLVQIFWPLMTKSSPSSRADVCRLARSLPAPGSE